MRTTIEDLKRGNSVSGKSYKSLKSIFWRNAWDFFSNAFIVFFIICFFRYYTTRYIFITFKDFLWSGVTFCNIFIFFWCCKFVTLWVNTNILIIWEKLHTNLFCALLCLLMRRFFCLARWVIFALQKKSLKNKHQSEFT